MNYNSKLREPLFVIRNQKSPLFNYAGLNEYDIKLKMNYEIYLYNEEKYQSNIPKCFKDETVTLLFAKPKAVCVNKTI